MKCLLRNVLGRFSQNIGWSPIAAALVVLVSSVATLAQTPSLVSDPEDGGELGDALTLTFLQIMKDPIAIRFEGAGGVEFLCEWQTFGGLLPNMILTCTP